MWDGKPDLNGVWQALATADWDLQDHSAQLGVPAGQGVVEGNDIPYQPWALAKRQENFKNRATADPEEKCFLLGVPRTMYAPFPFQIVHSPEYIAVFSEYAHTTRSIFMNSEHPPGPIEWIMGDSRGRWEGDTLVVDVSNFNGRTWLDMAANFVDENEHVVERFTLLDRDTIQYEATVTDPTVFVKPVQMRFTLKRVPPEQQILEYSCLEGERSLQHYTEEDGGKKARVK